MVKKGCKDNIKTSACQVLTNSYRMYWKQKMIAAKYKQPYSIVNAQIAHQTNLYISLKNKYLKNHKMSFLLKIR